MYNEPNEQQPCWKCEYMEYDTNLDEKWCNHKPSPQYLPHRCIVDKWGSCEYWKLNDLYKN